MSRRAVTLLIAGIGLVACLVIVFAVPVPYVALLPGPTYNTLGPLDGKPVIQISGHRTYTAPGHLNMVTVSYIGGPGANPPFNIFAALQAWLSPHQAVVPQEELFPPGQTQQQVVKQDSEQMVNSQQTAEAAALCQLGIRFATIDTISGTISGLPAAGRLQRGDVIKAVDGKPVTCQSSAATMIRSRPAGHRVVLTIARGGKIHTVALRTASYKGEPVIGVNVVESFKFPFQVKINIGNVGGPSAGMMFALAIIDKLTPSNLTGGKFIAGTGEIEVDGAVDPIGGIQQKMAAARAAGATVFLAPADNCSDTAGSVPAGLRVVKVSTLRGAIGALKAVKAGKPVPSC
ncbi:MAG TPA: S16 family serine protease [Streptosporangiaceae bacterium]|jgi:PDZ domain-containing protein|nr:S16 family serine protease [Streptosporangiaceae bacterium]